MIAKAKSCSDQRRRNASVASRALISGLWSYVGTSRGEGTSSRTSPSYGSSSPPLKKYVALVAALADAADDLARVLDEHTTPSAARAVLQRVAGLSARVDPTAGL